MSDLTLGSLLFTDPLSARSSPGAHLSETLRLSSINTKGESLHESSCLRQKSTIFHRGGPRDGWSSFVTATEGNLYFVNEETVSLSAADILRLGPCSSFVIVGRHLDEYRTHSRSLAHQCGDRPASSRDRRGQVPGTHRPRGSSSY